MTQNINLLEKKQSQTGEQDAYRRAGIAAVLIALVVATIASLQWRALDQARMELTRTRAESERLARAQADVAGPSAAWLAQLAVEEREVVALEGVARQLASGDLGRTRGFTEDLRAFGRATAPGVWLTGMKLDNDTDSMVLEGRAVDAWQVPGLIHALQSEPHFAGTRFESIDLKNGDLDAAGKPRNVAFRIVTPNSVSANEPGKRAPPGPVASASAGAPR